MTEERKADWVDATAQRHHILLKQACALIQRDYKIVSSFNNYREESYTIQCGFAVIIVCVLSFSSMATAIDYLIKGVSKAYILGDVLESFNIVKYVIPAFWTFVIYVIDLAILNHHRVQDDKKPDPATLLDALKGGFIKYIPANPMVLFRIAVILSSAVLSSLFVIVKINEQLVVNHTKKEYISRIEATESQFNLDNKEILAKSDAVEATIKKLDRDIQQLSLDKVSALTKRDKERSSISLTATQDSSDIREKLSVCDSTTSECARLEARQKSIYNRRIADLKKIDADYAAEVKEIDSRIKSKEDELKSLKAENQKLSSQVSKISSEKSSKIMKMAEDTDQFIEGQKNFGALVRYMIDGDSSGRIVSLVVFCIICTFFIIIDSSVMMLKYSRYSLYDRYMDMRDYVEDAEIAKAKEKGKS